MTGMQRAHMLVPDIGLLAYWSLSALMALCWIPAPEAMLYAGYHDPAVVAWNWSFLPLDVLLSGIGLAALATQRRGCAEGARLAQISLVLTFRAGFMVLSFWAIRGEFDPARWAVNLYLALWPLPHLARGVVAAGTWSIFPNLIGYAEGVACPRKPKNWKHRENVQPHC